MRFTNNKQETSNNKLQALKGLKFQVSSFQLRPGQVLILSLILLVVVMIISTAMFSQVTRFLQGGSRAVAWEQATVIADAGADYAVFKLNTTQGYSGNPEINLGLGTFKIDIADVAGNKKITSTGCIPSGADCKIKRVVKVEVTKEVAILFPYTIHAGASGVKFNNTGVGIEVPLYTIVRGDVFSNQNIVDDASGAQCRTGADPACFIYGQALATGPLIEPRIQVVPGPGQANYIPPIPLPTVDKSFWVAAAAAGGTGSTCLIDKQTNYILEAQELNCDLVIRKSSVIVKGPIYVKGNLQIISDSLVKLDDSLGSQGTVIVVDLNFKLNTGSQVLGNNATPRRGYILFYGLDDGKSSNWDLDIPLSKPHQAIYYRTSLNGLNGKVQVTGHSDTGCVPTTSTSQLTGAIVGDYVELRRCLEVLQDPNLSLATFSTGPGGSTWQIRRGTYKITVN